VRFFERLQTIVGAPEVSLPKRLRRICAADASYTGHEVISAASLSVDGAMTKRYRYRGRFTFPYVSGLFYLHEGPFVMAAIEGLRVRPQLVCLDAHGEAHPRAAGLAKTVGVILGIPSVGIAKSLLVGESKKSPDGGLERIVYKGGVLGYSTGEGRGKRYWSPGYSVTLKDLQSIINSHSETCLKGLEDAHRFTQSISIPLDL